MADKLKWHFVAHTSLDVFEERGTHVAQRVQVKEWKLTNLGRRTEASNIRQNDHYAGLLQIMDDYAV